MKHMRIFQKHNHRVKDQYTHQILYIGTEEMCIKYVTAFGLSYWEKIK